MAINKLEFKDWKPWVAIIAAFWFLSYSYLTAMQNVRQNTWDESSPSNATTKTAGSPLSPRANLADLPFDPVINKSLLLLKNDYSSENCDWKETSRQMSLIAMLYEHAHKFTSGEGVLLQALELDAAAPGPLKDELACGDLNNLSVVESLQAQATTNPIERQVRLERSQNFIKMAQARLKQMPSINGVAVPHIDQLVNANQKALDLQHRLDRYR